MDRVPVYVKLERFDIAPSAHLRDHNCSNGARDMTALSLSLDSNSPGLVHALYVHPIEDLRDAGVKSLVPRAEERFGRMISHVVQSLRPFAMTRDDILQVVFEALTRHSRAWSVDGQKAETRSDYLWEQQGGK